VAHAFHWTREALLAPQAPGSSVVTLSSGAAVFGSPLTGGYAGAKAAIRWLTAYAADEAKRAGLGIRFVSLLPQLTRRPRWALCSPPPTPPGKALGVVVAAVRRPRRPGGSGAAGRRGRRDRLARVLRLGSPELASAGCGRWPTRGSPWRRPLPPPSACGSGRWSRHWPAVGLGSDRFGAEFSGTGEQLDDRMRGQMLDEAFADPRSGLVRPASATPWRGG
jgi:hypothetical protein